MTQVTLIRLFWLVIFFAIALFALMSGSYSVDFLGLAAVLGLFLIALSWIDIETYRLPDWLTLPLIVLGIGQAITFEFVPLNESLIGAVLGYGIFWLIGTVYFRARGFEGLGLGDAKLLAAGGAWAGAVALSPIVLISCLFAIPLALLNRSETSKGKVAFGPWLAIGIWTAWWLGHGLEVIPVTLAV